MTRFIATWFYSGLAPRAPGTFGSLAALPFAYVLHMFGQWWWLAIAAVIVFFIGWWATALETKGKDDHDPSEIVIDEVAGQWIALIPVSFAASYHPEFPFSHGELFIYSLLAFALFRLFDITKPFPVSWADKKDTAFGVMMDDVLAGIMAAICIVALFRIQDMF
ncbi:phosphatidylglycerophosphatase A [Amylibacter kogurei]|uniref:Phosphatidylglycerophosphatase A n=1 Tax=Paramylibacter kogurei TaxID=1889778 RepID=A0A2G5K5H8_9RHOB|nr:phosphatidylglycerophosphatase A [Amylibacter kogurei]PIB24776.1 phosphatidylglycerophosphatase A [Amylibacter kogurei]